MTNERIGVAVLGQGFMGKAHSLAVRRAATMVSPSHEPALISICGRDHARLEEARRTYGFEAFVDDWRAQVEDDRVQLLVNAAPNHLHFEPTLAAVTAGKSVLCEKPLADSPRQALELLTAATRSSVVHLCGFNHRFFPAIAYARNLIEEGALGEIVHFRSQFLEAAFLDEQGAPTLGVLGDTASHVIDLARHLVGEVDAVASSMRRFASTAVEDSVTVLIDFEGGATGVLEASGVAGGVTHVVAFEINGTEGSIRFSDDRLNELQVWNRDGHRETRLITAPSDPFMSAWWPSPGHPIGWGDSFAHQMAGCLRAVGGAVDEAAVGADFRDGYRCAAITDAIVRASSSRRFEAVEYHDADLR